MMRKRRHRQYFVNALSARATRGVLRVGWAQLPVALGRSGQSRRKREGDGATPAGRLAIEGARYRSDRVARPPASLSPRPIRPVDGWCDAPKDRNYNRAVKHPYPESAERLWREDRLYDVVLILDYNRRPRVRGGGSAIFLHFARPGLAPTEGCVAVPRRGMRIVLAALRSGDRIVVGAVNRPVRVARHEKDPER